MAAVYKALSKTDKNDEPKTIGALRENRQRVLILSSRGVTFRSDIYNAFFQACILTNNATDNAIC